MFLDISFTGRLYIYYYCYTHWASLATKRFVSIFAPVVTKVPNNQRALCCLWTVQPGVCVAHRSKDSLSKTMSLLQSFWTFPTPPPFTVFISNQSIRLGGRERVCVIRQSENYLSVHTHTDRHADRHVVG